MVLDIAHPMDVTISLPTRLALDLGRLRLGSRHLTLTLQVIICLMQHKPSNVGVAPS